MKRNILFLFLLAIGALLLVGYLRQSQSEIMGGKDEEPLYIMPVGRPR